MLTQWQMGHAPSHPAATSQNAHRHKWRHGSKTTDTVLALHTLHNRTGPPASIRSGSTYADSASSAGLAPGSSLGPGCWARTAAACWSRACREAAVDWKESAFDCHVMSSDLRLDIRSSSSPPHRTARSSSASFSLNRRVVSESAEPRSATWWRR